MTAPQEQGMGCFGCLVRGIILLLAFVGFFRLSAIFVPSITSAVISPFYVTDVIRTAVSPDGSTVARIAVTKGGFGTVWTTRVHLMPKGEEGWLIYQTKDSDYVPALRWADKGTLLLGIGCDRFDYISNPDDWQSEFEPRRSFKVRLVYVDQRCAPKLAGPHPRPHLERAQ